MIRFYSVLLAVLLAVAFVVMGTAERRANSGAGTVEPALPSAERARGPGFLRGVALPLYYRESDRSYEQPLSEIAGLGADAVSLVVTWSQADARATEIRPDGQESRSDDVVRDAVRAAHAQGLRVLLFPILKLENREPGEWRGTIEPDDLDAWFESYSRFILHYARIAEETGAEVLSVGSELASVEAHEGRWRELIASVRAVYGGELIYSANWDHYRSPSFWDAVDRIGLSGYYELTDSLEEPVTLANLVKRWEPIRDDLVSFVQAQGSSLLFTEIGYYSQVGTAWHPWDYTRSGPVALDQQELCYRAFYEVWRDVPELSGVFFWHWWGDGGPEDDSYSPRGKPAEGVIRHWYAQWPRGERQSR